MSRWKRAQPNGALAEMMAADREDPPFGGYQGELAAPPGPAPAAPPPLIIPPPPWAEAAQADPPEEGSP